ncbi:MAG: hypothetical protein A4E60_00217 [Syntrophorhabdus sp. PtaB.Bin047]|nr:MAG: hypothetical protein A4E60_00217 [Syntrophorhabdus sp. PtaB.Bin047]
MKPFLLLLFLLLTGCAGAIYDTFPRQYPETHTVNITVIRSAAKGILIAKDVLLDGTPIAEIGMGEYLAFRVTPGTHSIGIPESLLAIDYKAGRGYYLHIVPDSRWHSGYFLRTELIDEKRAKSLLSEYANITPTR